VNTSRILCITELKQVHKLKRRGLLQPLEELGGKIIYRDKIDTIIGIKHPGIILGNDAHGTTWVIHSHYGIGSPEIVSKEKFCEGAKFFFDLREEFYNTRQIIERAIASWREKKEYSWLFHNCQHFVNKITKDQNYSDAIEDISNGALATGSLISLYGLFSGNKAAINAGLTIAGRGWLERLLIDEAATFN